MTNILSLKNLIRVYRVAYDSEKRTAFIVHHKEFGLPDMVFDMHPCGLHVYYCWKELPMPTAVIDRGNVLGRTERSLLVFTDRQGQVIGDYASTTVEQADAEENESVIADLYSSIPPAPDVTP